MTTVDTSELWRASWCLEAENSLPPLRTTVTFCFSLCIDPWSQTPQAPQHLLLSPGSLGSGTRCSLSVWPVISDPGPSNIFYCIRLHSDQEPSAHSLYDLWSKTQAPQTSFIGSGLTLTCGHWALPNGDMCTVAVLVKRWKSGQALLIRW